MGLLRLLILGFNVAIITFLVYRLLQIYESDYSCKGWIIAIGILLLGVPVAIIAGVIKPVFSYLLMYPVAISLFLYLIKKIDR